MQGKNQILISSWLIYSYNADNSPVTNGLGLGGSLGRSGSSAVMKSSYSNAGRQHDKEEKKNGYTGFSTGSS